MDGGRSGGHAHFLSNCHVVINTFKFVRRPTCEIEFFVLIRDKTESAFKLRQLQLPQSGSVDDADAEVETKLLSYYQRTTLFLDCCAWSSASVHHPCFHAVSE